MTDLTAFVEARLDEEERQFRASIHRPVVYILAGRLLRDVSYMRHALYCYGTPAARILAKGWSDHPDYRSEWAA